MKNTFYTRTLTALVFAVIMLAGILWSPLTFCLLFMIIAVIGLQEYFRLVKKIRSEYADAPLYQQVITIVLLPAGFLIASGRHFSLSGQPASFLGLQLGLFLVMLLIFLATLSRRPTINLKTLGYNLVGALYLGIPFSLMVHLMWNFSSEGIPILPLAILFSLWINDSLAYIVGSLIGKTPFFPAISPKKTWEGTLGGILLTVVAGAIYGYNSTLYTPGVWITIAGTTAVAGTAGDLLESKLKRLAKVKDSGHLMPGHGGILDRFDSMILAIPFVWLFMMLVH